jgi:hypothetical protein
MHTECHSASTSGCSQKFGGSGFPLGRTLLWRPRLRQSGAICARSTGRNFSGSSQRSHDAAQHCLGVRRQARGACACPFGRLLYDRLRVVAGSLIEVWKISLSFFPSFSRMPSGRVLCGELRWGRRPAIHAPVLHVADHGSQFSVEHVTRLEVSSRTCPVAGPRCRPADSHRASERYACSNPPWRRQSVPARSGP